ncbi:hypothetical protein CUJ84_Chr003526 [Rhizobium leguminosarum]|uniref:Uncharacterized protein n=1 Tax=Rhizobium leguminosarum TaxID=384 RepID=A0A2K9Z6K5_RHILE|nr:hypothetical protein CUJ84_Chr003526 [Rhizobium leguminosarum]
MFPEYRLDHFSNISRYLRPLYRLLSESRPIEAAFFEDFTGKGEPSRYKLPRVLLSTDETSHPRERQAWR